jgi:hypothetical protein
MEQLKEHRQFRNQLIVVTLVCLGIGIFMSIGELIAFGVMFGLLGLWNIFSYRENVKDYQELYGDNNETEL